MKESEIGRRCHLGFSWLERSIYLKMSKDMLTSSIEAIAAHDFKLKPMLVYHSENSRVLKKYTKSTLPETMKPGKQHIYLQHSLLNILSQLLRTTAH